MATRIKKPRTKAEMPEEFIRSAFAHLECAEKLNSLMDEGSFPCTFYKGRVVHWLAFHATELFLKGCMLRLNPTRAKPLHSLKKLEEDLRSIRPDLEIRVPFRGPDDSYPYLDPEVLTKPAKKLEAEIHERLRYPADGDFDPWPGAAGFDSELFAKTLKDLRSDFERIATELFVS